MHITILILIPLITAFIGWLTNKLAIHMLFHPRRRMERFGLAWQGLIPKRKEQIALKAAEILEREVLHKDLLRREISKIDPAPYIEQVVRKVIREDLGEKLKLKTVLQFVIKEKDLYAFERAVAAGIAEQLKPLRDRAADLVQDHIQIRRIVEERIREFDMDRFERVVREVAGQEFRTIEWLGAILGFFIGLIQVGLLLVTG